MSSLIKGIHHIALRASGLEKYAECKAFYGDLLGLNFIREWDENGHPASMYGTDGLIVELFSDAAGPRELGPTDHVAFATDDPDACVAAVKEAGYEITMELQDINIPTETTPLIARIAFCKGPTGESVEFFLDRTR